MRFRLLPLDPVSMMRRGKEEEMSDRSAGIYSIDPRQPSLKTAPLGESFSISTEISPLLQSPAGVCLLDRLAESLLFKLRCTM